MLKNIFITGIILLSVYSKIVACSCFPAGYHFCETIQNDPQIASIVMVQKLSDQYYGMQVKVLQVIAGEPTENTITVWGDNGALCRLYTGWDNGDTLILALHHTDMAGNIVYNPVYPPNLEDSADYHISGCGVYALTVNNGIVSGYIDAATTQNMPLNTFLSIPCIQTLGNEEHALASVKLYPNPSSQVIRFSWGNENISGLSVSIINSLGQILYQVNEFSPDGSINIQDLPGGAYTLVLYNGSLHRSFCFIKQ